MAEMYGKANGCSRGRGGSMHFFDAARRFYGGYAIVGGGLPIAAGLALADKMRGDTRVTACFFGEGAVAEGEFHESLNLAVLWHLPVLFLCENNLYAMGTALERSESETSIAEKAKSYRLPAESVDGMDVLAVEAATRARGRDTSGRATGRTSWSSARTASAATRWRTRSCIARRRRSRSGSTATQLRSSRRACANWRCLVTMTSRAWSTSVALFVDAAVAAAEAGPWEPVEDVLKYLTSDTS